MVPLTDHRSPVSHGRRKAPSTTRAARPDAADLSRPRPWFHAPVRHGLRRAPSTSRVVSPYVINFSRRRGRRRASSTTRVVVNRDITPIDAPICALVSVLSVKTHRGAVSQQHEEPGSPRCCRWSPVTSELRPARLAHTRRDGSRACHLVSTWPGR
jgi:hypothetical protein